MKARIILGIGTGMIAVAVILLLSLLGVPAEFSLAWILLLAVVALATRQAFLDESLSWPPDTRPRVVRNSEVSRLAWAINARTSVVGYILVSRVRRVLRRRLAHAGLELDDPAHHDRIDALLGAGIRESLEHRDVRSDAIERALLAIERLPTATQEAA
jgi:hypothetical protein